MLPPNRPAPASPQAAAVPGFWTVKPGTAMSLRPRHDGVLHLAEGAVWATLTGPHAGFEGGPQGDLFLPAGARLTVRAGQRVVIEPTALCGLPAVAVQFDWQPCSDLALSAPAAASWQSAVAQPASDLGCALRNAASALGQLLLGVLVWARGRWLPGAMAS